MASKMPSFVLWGESQCKALYAFLKVNWQAMAKDGKPIEVILRIYKDKRTLAQNRYYWRMLGEVAEKAWVDGRQYTNLQWHFFYKGHFLGYEETPGGKLMPISTRDEDIPDFADYVTKVEAHAVSELGVIF